MSSLPPAASDKPAVAIVGIGCRFPGGVGDAASFWALLRDSRDAIGEIPANRIDLERFYDPRPATPGRIITRRGGYLEGIEDFDAAFFGISPREAERLDPQQRMLLETAWEALEDAGTDTRRLEGSRTGVYVGQWVSDFESRLNTDPDRIDFLMCNGSGRYAASGRVSYVLGLRGPSLTLDTACSSSLVAVHLASRALQSGDCELALAGGVNLILQPHIHLAYSQSRMMAPDGRCKFGDASGDGYVRSEGAALVVLKRLDRALADGDRIYAVIRGSAVNNDGRSSGVLGRPSRIGHEELLRSAYADAGVAPRDVGYVEAHGTGTRAGDPVEIAALGNVLGEERDAGSPCLIGSVKTNIGHTESAAGIAGLIKAALVLHHGAVPASLHHVEPNPQVPWGQLPFRVPQALAAWPDAGGGRLRLAGVNSFGISGTNAHAVLEAAPVAVAAPATPLPQRPALLALSARSTEALRALARRHADRLGDACAAATLSREALDDWCWSAATRRTPLSHRVAFVADDATSLARQLDAFADGEAASAEGHVEDADAAVPAPVFVAPGQGGQWAGMARDLLAREPVFHAAFEACDAASSRYLRGDCLAAQLALEPGAPGYRLDRIELIQPALVALAIAYARWLQSVGVQPGALVGHSMGEVAAAHLAGVLDLDAAMRIICRRSALMARMRGRGGMAVVGLPMSDLERRLAGRAGADGRGARLSLAASNGPASSVVSGEPDALAALIAELDAQGIFARAVQVDVASHSAQMDGPAAALTAELSAEVASDIRRAAFAPHEATLPIHSTVLARAAHGSELDAAYWGRNLRQPVHFHACVTQLLAGGARCFVELGPHPVLSGAVQQTADAQGVAVATMACGQRDEPGHATLMNTVARLWTQGVEVDWAALLPRGRGPVDLPLYPWQRERHWCDAASQMAHKLSGPAVPAVAQGGSTLAPHPFLERRFDLAGQTNATCWETTLVPARFGYLADHVVRGSVLFPAAAYCEAALAAVAQSRARDATATRFALRDVEFHAAWALPSSATARLQVRLEWAAADAARFEIHGASGEAGAVGDEQTWVLRASGRIEPVPLGAAPTSTVSDTTADATGGLSREETYALLADAGLAYGPAFRTLTGIQVVGERTRAEFDLDPATLDAAAARYVAYPPLIDAVLQAQAAALAHRAPDVAAMPIPVRLGSLALHAPMPLDGRYTVHLRVAVTTGARDADADVVDAAGNCVATLRGIAFECLAAAGAARMESLDEMLHVPAWVPVALPAALTAAPREQAVVVVAADGTASANAASAAIVAALAVQGFAATLMTADELASPTGPKRLAQALRAGAPARGHVVYLGALACAAPTEGVAWIEQGWQRAGDETLTLERALTALEDAAAGVVAAPRLWLVTQGAVVAGLPSNGKASAGSLGAAALWGLGRVWAHEKPALDLTLVDFDAAVAGHGDGRIDANAVIGAALPDLLRVAPAERQLARRGAAWLALRLDSDEGTARNNAAEPATGAAACAAALSSPGNPDSLHWRSALRPAPRAHEVEIEVEHAGLNFMNLMSALGIYPGYDNGQGPLGIECSGRVVRAGSGTRHLQVGDAVVAVGHACLQSHAVVDAELVAPRPPGIDSTTAAGLPIAFLTAAYALDHLARLERGERVLIHSAAGGVGLAALQIARRAGAEVIATAGSEDKRNWLRSLGVQHVFDSRRGNFADEVLAATGGRGVDVVLNSLAGEAITAGLRCLAPYGRFVELGKRDIYGGSRIALAPFRANLSYYAVDLDRMMRERPAVLGRALRELMQSFASGELQPLPVKTYAADALVAAYRDLMPGTHVGKHVVALRPAPEHIVAAPGHRMAVHGNGCYVVTGGLGALGLEVARWLAKRGAGALMFVGRSAPGDAARAALAEIEAHRGTRVLTATCDVADGAALAAVLARARSEGGPIKGVFHAAGVLADSTLGAMTPATLRAPRDAKVFGAWHLERLTEGDALDAFVLFSSVASLFGTPGQGNYAAANAFLDALAGDRKGRGRPALSINLGPVAAVGLAAASAVRGRSLARLGFDGVPAERVVEAIDRLVADGIPQAVCAVFDAARWHAAMGREGAMSLVEAPPAAAQVAAGARGAAMPGAAPGVNASASGERGGAPPSLAEALAAVPAGPPRRAVMERAIKAEVSAVLRMALARIPTDRALKTLGLDSLMALELRNRLEQCADSALSPTLAWNHPTVRALAEHLAERMHIDLDAPAPAPVATALASASSAASSAALAPVTAVNDDLAALLDDLDQMSDEQARALLDQGAVQ